VVNRVEFISDRISYLIRRDPLCDDIVLNVHAPTEDKCDDIKGSFYEEVERVFYQIPKCHMKMLRDFNAKVGMIGNKSVYETSNDYGIRVINIVTSENLVVKGTVFPYPRIHNYRPTWTLPVGKTHHHIDHVLIDRRRQSSTYS
jgi:hypothetical protein